MANPDPTEVEVLTQRFSDDGQTPNNPELPLLLYRQALPAAEDLADTLEERFHANDWQGTWRWGVYDFHHFHSTAHEVLGVASGRARLLLGGAQGETFEVSAGDVVILPAGTGHCCLDSSGDFQVVGGYPPGQDADLIRSGEGELESAREHVAGVTLPPTDPLFGPNGPLQERWK